MEELITAQTKNKVLETVNDEYLRKRKRNRKIIYSCLSLFIFAIAVVIIVLACVRIDLKPYFLSEPTTITVETSEGSYEVVPSDSNFDTFNEIYENSFNSSILTSLFTGHLGSYSIEYDGGYFYSDDDNRTGIDGDLQEYLTENYVHLYYSQPQSLRNADGSQYTAPFSTVAGAIYYQDVYFNISSTDGEQDLTFYFGGFYGEPDARIYTITIRANTYDIYQFVVGE